MNLIDMSDMIMTDSGVQLYDGSIVILARFPGTKWIVHKGWYTYQDNQYNGWYVSSIPAQSTMPLTDADLLGIQVVSGGCGCPDVPFPGPPIPGGGGLSPDMKWELKRAWITVDTTEQLSNLNRRLVPDGKIVRVNDLGDGSPGYFRYDQPNQQWVPETFGVDTSNFVSKDDLSKEVSDQLKDIDISESVVTVIETNKSAQTAINKIVDSDINWKEVKGE